MADELTYRRLCDLCREEKGTNNLISLSSDFEQNAGALIVRMKQDADESGNLEASHEHLNCVRLFSMLMRMRRQKIVFRALQDGVKHDTLGMTEGEHALFDRICSIALDEEKRAAAIANPRLRERERAERTVADAPSAGMPLSAAQDMEKTTVSAPNGNGGAAESMPGQEPEARGEFKKLRILKDVPSYRSAEGQTLGPYKIGDEIPLPLQEAEWMVRGRLAEEIS